MSNRTATETVKGAKPRSAPHARDQHPALSTLPADRLVPPELQPDFLDPPGISVPPSANIADAILDAGPGSAVAVVHHESGREWTFADMAEASARLANALRANGLSPGERLAIRSPNRPEAIVAALAAWRLGAIVVPTPATARAAELQFFLRDTGAKALVAGGGAATREELEAASVDTDVSVRVLFDSAEAADEWLAWDDLLAGASAMFTRRELPANLPALIWHTGGTTGVPKACYHTHRRYLLAGRTFGEATGYAPGHRWAAAAPVGHALGFLCHTTFTLLQGASVVMIEAFSEPEAILRAIADHQVDTFVAIMASWARMLDALDAEPALNRIDSLRRGFAMWQSASSGAVYDSWRARGIELLNNFGSTAFANWILVPRGSERVPRASLGRATPGYEIRAVDPEGSSFEPLPADQMGRMAVRGPSGLTYWGRPVEQQRDVVDGWTLVDDLISIDDAGNASYLGRTDFLISSAGYKIAPIEVEEALSLHPAVREAAVIGTPDPIRQEIVTAFIVLAHSPPSESDSPSVSVVAAELKTWVKHRLSPYKYPRRIEFVERLPRDSVGKVQPRVLRQWAAERADRRVEAQ